MDTSQFFTDFKKNLVGQYEECQGYRLLCENQSFNPYNDLRCEEDMKRVPFIATTLFKKSNMLFMNLLRVKSDELEKWTVSSSTTGDPSIVGRVKSDISQMRKFVELQSEIFHPKCGYDCVFYPKPEEMMKYDSQKILGKYTESYIGNILNIFDFSNNTTFLLKLGESGFNLDIDSFVQFIKTHDNKHDDLSLRGSTLLLYNAVEQLKNIIPPVKLGERTIVHTGGGGWDGKKGTITTDKKIERYEFVETVSQFLGIPEENFIDTYSFTENSVPLTGHYSKEFRDYIFHVPDWGQIILRDIKTLEPVEQNGGRGFIQVLNAYGTNAYAGASILVDDIGEILSSESCPVCGQKCMSLRIIGRVKGSEAKGCGATLNVRGES
jgi:hypothetical protein